MYLKLLLVFIFSMLVVGASAVYASKIRVQIGFSSPAVYYGPPPSFYGSQIVYIPSHWENGYWVPGHYMEYAGEPGPGYIWVEHGWYRHHWTHHHRY